MGTPSEHGPIELQALEEELRSCYQCGKCTAGCPVAADADIPPNLVLRLVQLGDHEAALRARMIWLCASCLTCTARCPCQRDIAGIMDGLRREAVRRGLADRASLARMNRAFLANVELTGRIWEPGMLAAYNLANRTPFHDVGLAPKLLARGKLHLLPRRSRQLARVKAVFAAARRRRSGSGGGTVEGGGR